MDTISRYEQQLLTLALRFDQQVAQVQSSAAAKFVDIHIKNWSGIHVKSMGECTAVYSSSKALREWGHEWWIKVITSHYNILYN